MEYSNLYGDLNQLSLRFQNTEFSEVMVVHRMHLCLNELNVLLDGRWIMQSSDKVRQLYVLADVVQLPEDIFANVHLPASVSVVILCRVFYVLDANRLYGLSHSVRFPFMRLHVVETSLDSFQVFPVSLGDGSAPAAGIGLYINADRVIYRQDSTSDTNSVHVMGLRVQGASTFFTDLRPNWTDTLQVTTISCVLTLPRGPRLAPADSDLERSDEFELLARPSPEVLQVWFSSVSPSNSLSVVLKVDSSSGFSFFPIPTKDIPADVLTDASIISGMQMTMLIAELVLGAHNSPQVINVVTKHVKWLNEILLQLASPGDDIVALLFRVQAFLKMAKQPRSVVPRLQYQLYSRLISQMVVVAQNYDQEFKRLKLFIVQNQILGSYLLEQNKAFSEKEKEMSVFHSQVVSMRMSELNSAIKRMDDLSMQMEKESKAMDEAKEEMLEGIEEYERKQVTSAVFSVLGAIASVALAFVTAGATFAGAVVAAGAAVSAAGKLAAGLEKVVAILEALQGVMEMVRAIRDVVESMENIGQLVAAPEMPEMPSNEDWLIFVHEVEAAAEQVPTDVSQVSLWKAKCRNMAVLGQEMCTTAAHIAELQYQIKVEDMLQGIAERQAARLEGISAADLSSFTEMASQIDMRTTRLLLALIKVLHIQNAAIKYEYLYSASGQLDSWPVSMETVWTMLLQQESSAILGLLNLGPSNDLISTYVVKDIPVKLLVDGQDWQFVIPVQGEYAVFPLGWSRVRIRYIELTFVQQASAGGSNIVIHQPRTNTGLVYFLLQSSRFFHDRRNGVVMDYEASMGLEYAYAYNLTTGQTTLPNKPSSDHANTFMQMTPFNSWRLRLSASAMENQGLVFPTATSPDDTTQISITFHVTAIRRIDTRLVQSATE